MKIQNKVNNIIYGAVMLAPMVAVLSSCAYSIINKNATEDMTRTIQPSKFELNTMYHFEIKSWKTNNPSGEPYSIHFKNVELINIEGDKTSQQVNDYLIYVFDNGDSAFYEPDGIYWSYDNLIFNAEINETSAVVIPLLQYATYTYTETRDLRNTFYYSLDRVQEEPLFKWANNTPFIEVYKPFANFFGDDNNTVPFLLSYWTTVSLIMFGYEVITFMIVFARNLINKFEDRAGGF